MTFEERFSDFRKTHPYKSVHASGAEWRYLLTGNSDSYTLVFLNGGMNISEMWMDYIEQLADEYQLLMFDYPMEKTTCEDLASGIIELFKTLEIHKPILVGASFGGLLAEIIARKSEGLVKGLVLLSTGGLDKNTIKILKRKYFLAPLMLKYMEKCNYEKLKPKMIKTGTSHAKHEPLEVQAYVRDMFSVLFASYTKEKDLHATGLLLNLFQVKPMVPEDFAYLKGKVLLMLPKQDFFTPRMQDNLIALMQEPEIIYIEGGHLGTVLKVEQYSKTIRDFTSEL